MALFLTGKRFGSTGSYFEMAASDAFGIGDIRPEIPSRASGNSRQRRTGSVPRFRLGIDMELAIGQGLRSAVPRLLVGLVPDLPCPAEIDEDRDVQDVEISVHEGMPDLPPVGEVPGEEAREKDQNQSGHEVPSDKEQPEHLSPPRRLVPPAGNHSVGWLSMNAS